MTWRTPSSQVQKRLESNWRRPAADLKPVLILGITKYNKLCPIQMLKHMNIEGLSICLACRQETTASGRQWNEVPIADQAEGMDSMAVSSCHVLKHKCRSNTCWWFEVYFLSNLGYENSTIVTIILKKKNWLKTTNQIQLLAALGF